MKKVPLDKVREVITVMMNKENDKHSELLTSLSKRIDTNKYNVSDIIEKLSLIHESRINILQEMYDKIKSLE